MSSASSDSTTDIIFTVALCDLRPYDFVGTYVGYPGDILGQIRQADSCAYKCLSQDINDSFENAMRGFPVVSASKHHGAVTIIGDDPADAKDWLKKEWEK